MPTLEVFRIESKHRLKQHIEREAGMPIRQNNRFLVAS